jgi:hypothetical protein
MRKIIVLTLGGGVYFLKISAGGKILATGKLIVAD